MAAASKLVDANMNYAIATSWMPPAHPSMAKPDEYQALYNAAAASKDYDPALTQKVIQYMYDNAMIICLYADPRLAITQNYVKDPGFFSEGPRFELAAGRLLAGQVVFGFDRSSDYKPH